MHEDLDEIYKMALHKFHPEAILGDVSPYYWAGPMYRLFLESVCVRKQEIGLVLDPSSKGHEISPSCSIYTALRASFRRWVLFRLKFAIAATSRTSFVFNNQTKASHNPTLINKAFILYSQYPDCNLSFLLVLRLPARNRPSWSG